MGPSVSYAQTVTFAKLRGAVAHRDVTGPYLPLNILVTNVCLAPLGGTFRQVQNTSITTLREHDTKASRLQTVCLIRAPRGYSA